MQSTSLESATSDSATGETLRLLTEAAAGAIKPDPKRVQSLRDTVPGFERALWKSMGEQGWLSILVNEADGGLGLGLEAACVIARRLGYAAYPEPFTAAGVMTPRLLTLSPNVALKERLLPDVMTGDLIATVAWQNEAGSISTSATQVMASESGSDTVLNGASRLVPVAAADAFIVAAKGVNGLSLHWVARDAKGLSVTSEATPDGGAFAYLRLDGVRSGAAETLATGIAASTMLAEAVDLALIAASAEMVGLMERELELTLDYLKTRKQFGQAIGSFQALQHRSVDVWMQKELARHATDAAARTADRPGTSAHQRAIAASGAKFRASDAAMLVSKQAIQLHGAIGYTDEYELGLSVNRALFLSSWLGNAADHKKRFAELNTSRGR